MRSPVPVDLLADEDSMKGGGKPPSPDEISAYYGQLKKDGGRPGQQFPEECMGQEGQPYAEFSRQGRCGVCHPEQGVFSSASVTLGVDSGAHGEGARKG